MKYTVVIANESFRAKILDTSSKCSGKKHSSVSIIMPNFCLLHLQKNSFCINSVLFRLSEDRLSVNMSEEEQVNNGAAQAMSFLEETRTSSTPIETIAELKENSLTQASKGNATSSEHLNQIRVEQTLSEISSQPSGDSDPSGVKTYNDSDVSHPPVVGVDDVRNLISSPESKSQSINDSMVGELSPDIQAILSSTPELEGTVSLSGNNRSSLDKSSSHDLKGPLELAPAEESVNTNSLFAELANQEPSAIEEIDEGAEISLMGKELESVLKENEELVETK